MNVFVNDIGNGPCTDGNALYRRKTVREGGGGEYTREVNDCRVGVYSAITILADSRRRIYTVREWNENELTETVLNTQLVSRKYPDKTIFSDYTW